VITYLCFSWCAKHVVIVMNLQLPVAFIVIVTCVLAMLQAGVVFGGSAVCTKSRKLLVRNRCNLVGIANGEVVRPLTLRAIFILI